MNPALEPLTAAVQANCHIADARHAADLSLCTFLLQMRELFRWEQRLPLSAALPREAVGAWLADRETLWADLEDEPFRAVPVGPGIDVDPFDIESVNAALEPMGLVYGAGLLGPGQPTFFVARLIEHRRLDDGVSLLVCGDELARCLLAPPAALQGHTIILRRESMARWLWERFGAVRARRQDGPLGAVIRAYGLDTDFEAALPRLLDEQGRALLLHEWGELLAGRWLEPDWSDLRSSVHDRRAGLLLRAVRDHLADLTHTLPVLLADGPDASVHVWFAGYDGLRRQLFPSLFDAYAAWSAGDQGHDLRHKLALGRQHFSGLARQVLALHRQEPGGAAHAIAALLASSAAICSG